MNSSCSPAANTSILPASIALAVRLDLARGDVHRALGVLGGQLGARAGSQLAMHIEQRRMRLHRRWRGRRPRRRSAAPGRRPRAPAARPRRNGQNAGSVSSCSSGRATQAWMPCTRRPAARACSKRSEWVMPRPAVIQLTSPGGWPARRRAVAVHDLAGEQIGDRGEPDVRVRAHVHRRNARRESHRPDVIEEDERPDHVPARKGRTRPTSKPPRSRRRWSMTSMAESYGGRPHR